MNKLEVVREILIKNERELKSLSNPAMGPHKTLYDALVFLLEGLEEVSPEYIPFTNTDFSKAFSGDFI